MSNLLVKPMSGQKVSFISMLFVSNCSQSCNEIDQTILFRILQDVCLLASKEYLSINHQNQKLEIEFIVIFLILVITLICESRFLICVLILNFSSQVLHTGVKKQGSSETDLDYYNSVMDGIKITIRLCYLTSKSTIRF